MPASRSSRASSTGASEAMERFFDGAPGGYVDLITRRRRFPRRPPHRRLARLLIRRRHDHRDVRPEDRNHVGHVPLRADARRDGVHAATIEHVTVATDLDTMTKLPLPDDRRHLLEQHRDEQLRALGGGHRTPIGSEALTPTDIVGRWRQSLPRLRMVLRGFSEFAASAS